MTRLPERLARLEQAHGTQAERASRRAADLDADAAILVAKIKSLAGKFDVADSAMPVDERFAKMSPAQHCAWEMRFADRQTPVSELMAMHDASRKSGSVPGTTMENPNAHR